MYSWLLAFHLCGGAIDEKKKERRGEKENKMFVSTFLSPFFVGVCAPDEKDEDEKQDASTENCKRQTRKERRERERERDGGF